MEPVLVFLAANTVTAVLYYTLAHILAHPRISRQERICGALIILLVPAGGAALMAITSFRRRMGYPEALSEFISAEAIQEGNRGNEYGRCNNGSDPSRSGEVGKSESTSPYNTAGIAGKAANGRKAINRNAVSFYDILLTADNNTKRSVLLDIFKEKPHRYIRQLKAALDDFDTETSHYASVALVEIKREYDNRLIALGEKLRNSPDDRAAACEYADIAKNYIGSKILDAGNENRLKQNYIGIIGKFLNDGENRFPAEYYIVLADYFMDGSDYAKAEAAAVRTAELYPDDERSYFMLMKVYYKAKQKEKFEAVLAQLMKSSINISREGLSKIRYFTGRY